MIFLDVENVEEFGLMYVFVLWYLIDVIFFWVDFDVVWMRFMRSLVLGFVFFSSVKIIFLINV